MHQVTADKFCMAESDLALRGTRCFPSGRESNGILRKGKDPAVGNGDPMCVTAKILDGIAETVKGFLYVRTPVFFIKTVFPFLKAAGILQMAAGGRKGKGAALIQLREAGHIFSFEFIPEDFDREKELTGGKT